ncbi:MAG: OmpA family protein [Burkholderiaceae bacterium]
MASRVLAFVVALAFAPLALADLGFPDSVKLPPQLKIDPDQALVKETLAEAEFRVDASGSKVETKRGEHYARWLQYKPAAGEPALGYYNGSEERIYKALVSALQPAGWQVVYVEGNKNSFTMRRGESWLAVKMDAPQAQVNLELIEPKASANPLVLKAPAAQPEKVGDNDDLPWLSPYPGSKRKGGGRADGPLDVSIAGDAEPRLVGNGVQTRTYDGPKSLSLLQFNTDYRDALAKAGWTIVFPPAGKTDSGLIIAHYVKDGRDLWAKLSYEYGASLWFSTVDVGAEDWAAKLAKDCRLPLYGVFFDFNKATIKPESDAVLARVAKILGAKPVYAVEVQGHTDNVGGDDYNVKLSNERAGAVKAWLASHNVDGAKLTAKGYGKAQPVADNATDAGRAKNRRVELRRPDCKPS